MFTNSTALQALQAWLVNGLISAAVALALIYLAARWGSKLAGLLTGLPIVGGPAVLLLAQARGPAFAHDVFEGAVVAGVVCAVYASSFGLVAWLRQADTATQPGRKTTQALVVAGAAALLATVLAVALLQQVQLTLPWLAVLCLWLIAACVTLLTFVLRTSAFKAAQATAGHGPGVARAEHRGASQRTPSNLWVSTGVAGGVGVVASICGDVVGPFGAGLVASLPWLCTTLLLQLSWLGHRQASATHGHAASTCHSVLSFLHGYVLGLLGRSVFVALVAVFFTSWGPAIALLVAALAAAITTQVATRYWCPQNLEAPRPAQPPNPGGAAAHPAAARGL
jgi:hypothetical protein